MSVYSERVSDVVIASVEVAADSATAGSFTPEVARALTAVVGKVAERAMGDAELNGFVTGWQEAMATLEGDAPADAQVYQVPAWDVRGQTGRNGSPRVR
ncbi:hypothetical protein ACFYZ9_14780 [Streptomyces sp. NPDC001691]|uniref:hypothetical protein n=1 Tax=unclassified Streptomyces TaxID=2593676 RepID=UPI001CB9A275|nr:MULTISPECIES: hypothetical protein [unclassified Streptomyces]